MHRQLSEKRQITLPPKVLKDIGAEPGQFFEIRTEGRQLILMPMVLEVRKKSEYDWEALDRLVKNEKKKAKTFKNAVDAKNHAKKLASS